MKVLLLVLLHLLFVSSHLPSSIPNPKKSPASCGLSSNSAVNERWVCDIDSILEKNEVSTINDIISQTNAQTAKENPSCAVEIAVVVIKAMDAGYGGSSSGAESFARELHRTWGVGSKECQNGILVFFSVDDRKWFISTGKGANKIVSSNRIGKIREQVTPMLKNGEYGRAIHKMVSDISEYMIEGKEDEGNALAWLYIFSIIFLFGAVLLPKWIIYGYIRVKELFKTSEYKKKKEKLEKLRKRIEKDKRIDATTCSICLEDFAINDGVPDGELLACNHIFHKKCISQWLKTKDMCPLCRRESPRDERPKTSRPKPIDMEWVDFTSERLDFEFAPFVNVSTRHSTRYWDEWSNGHPNSSDYSSDWGGGSDFGGAGGDW